MLNMKKIYEIHYDDGEIKVKSLMARETDHQYVVELFKAQNEFMKSGIGSKRISKDGFNVVRPGMIIYTDDKQFGVNAILDELSKRIKDSEIEIKKMKRAVCNVTLGG